MYKNIYVITPYALTTGGIELCHQLVDYLRNKGQNAFIVYESNGAISSNQDVTTAYKKYNITTCSDIVDSEENILILPEIYFNFIHIYSHIKIGCWWMSVDNHFGEDMCIRELLHVRHKLIDKMKLLIKYIFFGQYRGKYSDKILLAEKKRIFHFYQSRYAQYYLYSKGYSNIMPLSDYINTELSIPKNMSQFERENIVLYNPKKGLKFTKQLISQMPNIRFVALEKLSREELKTLMCSSKIYIDFGHFPGKDRLPREAVMNGCCVITGRNGASFFYEDVPILDEYKFSTERTEIPKIKREIEDIFCNFEMHCKDFNRYRRIVAEEQQIFYNEIDNIFLKDE